MTLFRDLEQRGLLHTVTEGFEAFLSSSKGATVYSGFDPTAPSLHVGNLVPLMGLLRFLRAGHPVIALVGGGTGLIGDPSGKKDERKLQSTEQVWANVAAITRQLESILGTEPSKAWRIENNAEWLTALTAIELLRDVGKHFSVSYMLGKESIRTRVETGLSFTEFSYLVMQAYDFLQLYERRDCTVQIGGSDQWGNITAGIDLIRRHGNAKAHGLVLPLVTTASGQKFGKTEAGTVWLDPARTSPYEFYQFWLNVDDRDAVRYLRMFTFLDEEEIAGLASEPGGTRAAQRALARDVTTRVHGEAAVRDAEAAAGKLFSGDLTAMDEGQLLQVFASAPSTECRWFSEDPDEEWPVRDFLASTNVTASKGEAARLIKGGGIYVNDARVADEKQGISLKQALLGRFFVVRKGKKGNFLVKILVK